MTIDTLATAGIDNSAAKGRSRRKGRPPVDPAASNEAAATLTTAGIDKRAAGNAAPPNEARATPESAVAMPAAERQAGTQPCLNRGTATTPATGKEPSAPAELPSDDGAADAPGVPTGQEVGTPPVSAETGAAAAAPARQSKKATLLLILQRAEGASIAELMSAAGWQAHTVRAFLTGVRKDGKALIRTKDDAGPTRYRIAAEA